MRRNHFSTSIPLLCMLLLSSCEFRSRRVAWSLDSGVTYKVRYSSELRAKAHGSWGSAPYVSAAQAGFSVRSVSDSSKGQIELSLTVDTLDYRSSERKPEEDRYMSGRLRRYKAKLSLSRTGRMLSLEEEPVLPPVAFSPLNFGRFLAYSLPAFPDAPVKKGSRWEIVQPLQDKFHPDSRVVKRFTLSAIRETPKGDLATCLVEVEAFLDEDLGAGVDAGKASLSGSGQVVFNLSTGRPVSAELELEGRFASPSPPKYRGFFQGGRATHAITREIDPPLLRLKGFLSRILPRAIPPTPILSAPPPPRLLDREENIHYIWSPLEPPIETELPGLHLQGMAFRGDRLVRNLDTSARSRPVSGP